MCSGAVRAGRASRQGGFQGMQDRGFRQAGAWERKGPFGVTPELSKGRGSKAPTEPCSSDSELTQETGPPHWRDLGTGRRKRGHVRGAKLNTILP